MSARDAAAKVQPGSTVRWDRLERAAFAAHSSVREDGGTRKKTHKNKWNLIWGIPLVILYFFCYLAPILGTAAISVSRFQTYQQDAAERIPLSGTLFVFALFLLVISFVHWLFTGRRRNGFYEMQAGLALVLGGLSAVAVRMYGLNEPVHSWQTWIISVLATVALAAVFLSFLVVAHISQDARPRSKSGDGTGGVLPRNKIELLKRRREQVAQLPSDERAAIERDLEDAISNLLRRGLISEVDAERACGAELGALGLRMPQARASK